MTNHASSTSALGPGLDMNSTIRRPIDPLDWFGQMIPRCKEYATAAKASGRPIIGIMCEYAPRELILAAGGVPVCLCGGDPDTIPAAEAHLPANLCPLIKSTYGYCVEKSNPFLEMADLVLAETTCDGKKKMFELMAGQRATYLLELPQKEDDQDALEHWVMELRKFKVFLEQRYHTAITDEKMGQAVAVMNRERSLRLRLAESMKSNQPRFTGRQLLEFKSIISGIPADLAQYEYALDLARAETKPTAASSTKARVLLTGVPLVHGVERVMDLIEGRGGLVVCQENCTGLKPLLENVAIDAPDLLRSLAAKYYHLPCSVRTPNRQRFRWLRQLAADYRPECVIELIWHACHTYAIESYYVKEWTEKELGLPYLKIETDYSPADSPRLAVRIEALMETALDRRAR